MPISPENAARYPADWPQIVERIRRRAGNRCEECGIKNHTLGVLPAEHGIHKTRDGGYVGKCTR